MALEQGHLSDSALLALIDGEATDASATDHLGGCGACDGRMTALKRSSELLRASLPPVAIPPLSLPTVPAKKRPWLYSYPALAAATVLLLASVAAATPVRRWIARQFTSTPPAPVEAPTNPVSPTKQPASGIIASFAAVDTLLEIRVDSKQKTGFVQLTVATSDRISAQAVSGAAAEELVVLPGQLRIINSPSSVADYRIAVPPAVRSIVVIVAGERAATVKFDAKLDRRIGLSLVPSP